MEQTKRTGYPSIDKPWLKYYSEEAINAPLPECTIYEYLYQNNRDYLQDTALIYFNRKINYGKLFENINRVESALRAVGVAKGQIVTVNLPSIPETVYLLYALSKIGAIANMIDPRSDTEMLQHYLSEAGSKVFICLDKCLPVFNAMVDKAFVETVVCISAVESLPFASLIGRKLRNLGTAVTWKNFLSSVPVRCGMSSVAAADGNAPVLMTHTSGTTGLPKGVVLSNKNINAVIHQYSMGMEHHRRQKYLCVIPPFIAFGICVAVHLPLGLGMADILVPQFDPQNFYKYLKKYTPEHFTCAPMSMEPLITKQNTTCLSFLCTPAVGGDYINDGFENRINECLSAHGCKHQLVKGYGMTEVSSSACTTSAHCNALGSVGVPLVNMTISVFAIGTPTELTYGQEGELCFTGPNVMQGYYKNSEATAAALKLHADGQIWMHSGDIGYMSEDGHVYVVDRLKRAITVDGQIILPAKTERVLLAHPYVEKCAVVGNERSQFVAHVVLSASAVATEVREQLAQACDETLSENARPVKYIFCNALPLTPVGKVDYRALERR